MTERTAVLMAFAAFVGALHPWQVAWWIPAIGAAVTVLVRVPVLLPVTVLVLCASLAQRSWDGLEASEPHPLRGSATVVTDPERFGAGTSAVVRVDGRRYLARGFGSAGAALSRTSAGERIEVDGDVVPYTGWDERRAALHVADQLRLQSVQHLGMGNPLWRTSNGIRSLVADGAEGLGERRRILFTGLVYGDDRGQDPGIEADFRQAGLTHLLAVSGQNVAYVLTLLRPVLERLPLRGRWVLTMLALLVFATMTRFEPSVLRATAMAAIAVTATTAGRATSSVRNLALAVTALLVIDPLLAETAAFRLSVAASAGIALLDAPIRSALPGPEWIRGALSVTLAAQLAVAPVLMTMFGPMSVISLPANVLAGPLAGAVMAWGMTAGIVAGLVPALAGPVHAVTRVLLVGLETVASLAADVPISSVGLDWVLVAAVALGGFGWWRLVPGGRLVAAAVLVILALQLRPSPPEGDHVVGNDSTLTVHNGMTSLQLGDEFRPVDLVTDVRHLGVRHLDTVVAADPEAVRAALVDRITFGRIVPPD